MISRELLENMFADMRKKSKWNVDGPLLWGYFFTALDKAKLEAAASALVKDGYTFVDIWLPESKESEDSLMWWLHVERVEHHTVDSLHKRNTALYALASKFGLESYDGMDVGPAAKLA